MRACACDTASRLCVRTVVCWSAFSLVPPPGSTCSSAARAASFAGFTATMGESDFSGPFIVGFGLRPSRPGPCKTPQGQSRDIPVPDQEASAHASVYDAAEPTYVSRSRDAPLVRGRGGSLCLHPRGLTWAFSGQVVRFFGTSKRLRLLFRYPSSPS